MPTTQLHIFKAERNEDFYKTYNLDTSRFNEWAVVVLFYILLHYVDAVLRQDISLPNELRDPIDHPTRNRVISQCSALAPISSMYINLYNRSREARYWKLHFPGSYLHGLITFSFKPAHDHLRKRLGLS